MLVQSLLGPFQDRLISRIESRPSVGPLKLRMGAPPPHSRKQGGASGCKLSRQRRNDAPWNAADSYFGAASSRKLTSRSCFSAPGLACTSSRCVVLLRFHPCNALNEVILGPTNSRFATS